uniref:MFS domain-containing protein n=1 Tax=Heterorhabditis bacteriophora TaxID=37862 RepID=A0A1I7XTC3_HETBA
MDDQESTISSLNNIPTEERIPSRKWVIVVILLVVNLLNYMDRFTIAGVLIRLRDYFSMDDEKSGMLQTVFIVFYMLFAPVCGYLGDRYNRKFIIIVGLSIWIIAVYCSTLVTPEYFHCFLFLRGLVGVGEASYSTIAPSIIADSFTGSTRSIVLMVFYFAVPVGSGFGYIGGSYIALWSGSWQWGVRFTPIFGVICLFLIIFLLEEPTRGQSEHAELMKSTIIEDLKYLIGIRTYLLTTLGFTCVVFAVGSLSWWTPTLVGYAYGIQHKSQFVPKEEAAHVSLIFGLITCAAGIVGVVMGSTIAQAWREGRWGLHASHRADASVCALGSLLAVPLLYTCLVASSYTINITWCLMFMAVTCMCLNWAVNMDMLMIMMILQAEDFLLYNLLFSCLISCLLLVEHFICGQHFMLSLIKRKLVVKCIVCLFFLFKLCSLYDTDIQEHRKRSSLLKLIIKKLIDLVRNQWTGEGDGDDVETLIPNIRRNSANDVEE